MLPSVSPAWVQAPVAVWQYSATLENLWWESVNRRLCGEAFDIFPRSSFRQPSERLAGLTVLPPNTDLDLFGCVQALP